MFGHSSQLLMITMPILNIGMVSPLLELRFKPMSSHRNGCTKVNVEYKYPSRANECWDYFSNLLDIRTVAATLIRSLARITHPLYSILKTIRKYFKASDPDPAEYRANMTSFWASLCGGRWFPRSHNVKALMWCSVRSGRICWWHDDSGWLLTSPSSG